jgi:Transport and Golgi organisation 2
MCTVTFIPAPDGIFLVSNRDEKYFRGDALPPDAYEFHTGKIVFPKDADKGGTWIAMHEQGKAVVFLNGGREAHRPEPPYRKSRGLVLLDLINADSSHEAFEQMDFSSIEPFTAVVWETGRLFELIWDGEEKHITEKDNSTPHIWSSVTLYEETTRSKRRRWFDDWLERTPDPGMADILHFHQFSGEGDAHNDLMMNRDGEVFTVSITGMHLTTSIGQMEYLDVKNKKRSVSELRFRQSTAVAPK